MIGNDIVDLRLATTQSDWQRRGWLQKIFTKSEQEVISKATNSAYMVWKLWSMKEAAYKAHQRRFLLSPKYNPWDYICTESYVTIDMYVYQTYTEYTDTYIHTTAFINEANYVSRICKGANAVIYKDILSIEIAKIKEVQISTITIEKDQNNIPFINIENKAVDIVISLSNHGDFSAFIIKKT